MHRLDRSAFDRRAALRAGLAAACGAAFALPSLARGGREEARRFGIGRVAGTRGEPLEGRVALAPREVRVEREGKEKELDLRRVRSIELVRRAELGPATRDEEAEAELDALAKRLLADPRDRSACDLWQARLSRGYAPFAGLAAPLAGALWVVPDTTRHHAEHAASVCSLDLAALDDDGRPRTGVGRRNEDWAGWDAELLAVADGRVQRVRDHLPDDAPFEGVADPERANDLVLEIEGGLAFYQHLRQGSALVAAGDRVARGQPLARLGNSGNASWPHLHFAVYERFVAGAASGWLSVPIALESTCVSGLRADVDGRARALDLRCELVPLQEGWVARACE